MDGPLAQGFLSLTAFQAEGCGRLMAAGCVEGLHRFAQGAEEKVLKMDGPSAQGFLSLTALWAEGCGLPLCGNTYNVSVTGLTFQYHMTYLPQGKVVATATKEGKRRNGT
ncbi:hypothetical protein HMPREF9453_00348 [Dialister succinatiphilus YIT 11850]|uniref:Uncharacterized protein n=1 Tax=Dialister succinatiphilus YIT 11850 TaxID=742743 RepID=H1CYB0_9FIRM|nr:hypothetical protein HMPREF9453_00348 [Dialister succinatiphilus YIT 11850]